MRIHSKTKTVVASSSSSSCSSSLVRDHPDLLEDEAELAVHAGREVAHRRRGRRAAAPRRRRHRRPRHAVQVLQWRKFRGSSLSQRAEGEGRFVLTLYRTVYTLRISDRHPGPDLGFFLYFQSCIGVLGQFCQIHIAAESGGVELDLQEALP